MGHAPVSHWNPKTDALFGAMPDYQIAKRLGISQAAVRGRRIRLGIQVFNGGKKLMLEGEQTAQKPVTHKTPAFLVHPDREIRTLTPPISNLPCLAPLEFFTTSGEAVMKTDQLIREIADYFPAILAQEPTLELATFAVEVHAALDEARRFRETLVLARGPAVFLECEYEDGAVRCQRKNPRSTPNNYGRSHPS